MPCSLATKNSGMHGVWPYPSRRSQGVLQYQRHLELNCFSTAMTLFNSPQKININIPSTESRDPIHKIQDYSKPATSIPLAYPNDRPREACGYHSAIVWRFHSDNLLTHAILGFHQIHLIHNTATSGNVHLK